MPRSQSGAVLKISFVLAVIILNAVGGVVSPSLMVSASTKAKVISIAEARRLPLGTVLTIEGSVTVPSGTFKASVSDEGFAVQDKSGGIYVSMSTNLGLRVRQRVRVTGKLAESLGLLLIVPVEAKAVEVRGRGAEVQPENSLTGKIGETTEGRLVKVTGMLTREVTSDMPYGFHVFLNDGSGEIQVFVSASTKIDLGKLKMGQRVRVTGFSGQYKDHYEVSPRSQADIRTLIPRNRRPPP